MRWRSRSGEVCSPDPKSGRGLARAAFRENAPQRASVHVQAARRFRDIAVTKLEYALNVFPAHAAAHSRKAQPALNRAQI